MDVGRKVPSYLEQEEQKTRYYNVELDWLEVPKEGTEIKILPQPNEESPFLSLYFWNSWTDKIYVQAYEMNWGQDRYKDPFSAVVQLLSSYGYNVMKPKLTAYMNVYDLKEKKVKVLRISKMAYESILKIQRKQLQRNLPLLEEDNGISLELDLKTLPQGITTIDITPGVPTVVPQELYLGKTVNLRNRLRPTYTDEKVQALVTDAYKYAMTLISTTQSNAGSHIEELKVLIKKTLQSVLDHNLLINSRNKLEGGSKDPFSLGGATQQVPSNTVTVEVETEDLTIETPDFDSPFSDFGGSLQPQQPVQQAQPIQQSPPQVQQQVNPKATKKTATPNVTTTVTESSVTTTVTPQAATSSPNTASNTGKIKIPGSPACYGTKVAAAGLDCNSCAYMLLCHS